MLAPSRAPRFGGKLDPDGHDFIIAAAIPRAAIPLLPALGTGDFVHTIVDFDAPLASKTKLWRSDADGSTGGITSDIPSEARLYPGAWATRKFTPSAYNPAPTIGPLH